MEVRSGNTFKVVGGVDADGVSRVDQTGNGVVSLDGLGGNVEGSLETEDGVETEGEGGVGLYDGTLEDIGGGTEGEARETVVG